MQLKFLLGLALAAIVGVPVAQAQSLSPMHKTGDTPSDTKGFNLTVGNPYDQSMVFEILVMDPKFETIVERAVAQPPEVRLGRGLSRTVLVAFKIPAGQKERTIGVCVQPKQIEGTVLPRVCGTYTGVRLFGTGG